MLVLKKAQQDDRSLMDLYSELVATARESAEAALLLRDLWEVLRVTDRRIANQTPEKSGELLVAISELMRKRYSGEDVLF